MRHLSAIAMLALLFLVGGPVFPSMEESLLVYNRMERERFTSDENMMLTVCVKNISAAPVSFKIYSGGSGIGDYITFQPVVFDRQGNEAETIVPYKMKNLSLQTIAASLTERIVTLDPGEIFSHAMAINSIYKIEKDVPYRIRSFFVPDAITGLEVIKSNNELSAIMTDRGSRNVKSGIIREKPERIADRTMSPSEVIAIHLLAEKNRDTEKYIKYIDVPKYINSYSDYVRVYQLADDEEKRSVEEDFINFLSRERDDYILDFKIVQEEVENNQKISYVDVVAERFGARKPKWYQYRFSLEKDNNHWLITGLEATIMKGATK